MLALGFDPQLHREESVFLMTKLKFGLCITFLYNLGEVSKGASYPLRRGSSGSLCPLLSVVPLLTLPLRIKLQPYNLEKLYPIIWNEYLDLICG